MAKKIMQFRYYRDGHKDNYPADLTAATLNSGAAFANCGTIIQLGIQSLPGLRFQLNNSNAIMIGSTGIYELNVEGYAEIKYLNFQSDSLKNVSENDGAYLIIDVISKEEGGNTL
jgi:hypothetical protein